MSPDPHNNRGTPLKVIDPVCEMSITDESPFVLLHNGSTFYFCSEACERSFRADPQRYLRKPAFTSGQRS